MNNIIELLNKLKIAPRNISLYEQAITHSSFTNPQKSTKNYERLEYLGDAIISKIVAEHLFRKHDELDENGMSKARNMIVQSKTEVKAAKDMNLIDYINIGQSMKFGVGITDKILEDVFEALIGAIYLDQGEKAAYKIIKRTIIHYYEIKSLGSVLDFKTMLQEKMQSMYKVRPRYKRIPSRTPNTVVIEVWCRDKKISLGVANTNKDAEFEAAKKAYQILLNRKS